jgi:ubiquinone/menaquinone biosynthesis C-methylase UbiE
MSYNNLALVYDKLMEDIDYQAWANYLDQLISKYKAPGKELIDLGCGTGSISLKLAQKGYNVLGIDYSEEMLSQADQKFRENNIVIPLYHQDIRQFVMDRNVDIVISTFDTLNYILDEKDIERTFKNVFEVLKKDALFIFDINTPYKLKEILGDNIFTYNTEEISYIWENDFDDKENICQMCLTFFILDQETGLYERFEEFHEQKSYEIDYLIDILHKTGFKVLNVHGELNMEEPKEEDHKVFIIAKK